MESAPVILNVETALAACRGDANLARALLERYRADLPEARAALLEARAAASPEWETVRKRVHRLCSGSAYLGAERIADAARTLEESIARGSPDAPGRASQALAGAIQDFLNASLAEAFSK
jgi:HPt (histidine-containing phosphotransfer) domain-containing protein